MARKPDAGRREELEAAVADYLLAQGMADVSLRAVAKGLGISTYPLIYHFGSKDGLVTAALATIEERQQGMITDWMHEQPERSLGEIIRRYWDWATREEMLPYHRLYFEIYGLALRYPGRFDEFMARGGARPWTKFLREAVRNAGMADAEMIVSLMIATVAGVLLVFLTDGDREQATRTIEAMLADVERHIAPDGESPVSIVSGPV
ncbi:MAG TPA: TetR/AcrR family transcriptional regulator [Thermomicrobiales bacterium]|jgi:AcrR family transcriptional regulator